MPFNSSTLFLVDMLVLFWAAGASLLTWIHRSRTPGLRSWAAALMLIGFGNFVLYHSGARAPFWVLALAGTANVACFATMWAGLRRFRDGSMASLQVVRSAAAVSAGFLGLFSIAGWFGAPVRAHSVVFLTSAVGLTLLAARETWRSAGETGLGARRVAAAAIAGIAAAHLVRLLVVILQVDELVAPRVAAVLNDGMRYFATSCILVATYGLIFVASNQLARNKPASLTGTGTGTSG